MTEAPLPLPPRDPEMVQARPVLELPYARARLPSPLALPMLSPIAARMDLGLIVLTAIAVPIGFELAAAIWLGDELGDPGDAELLTIRKWFDVLLAVGLMAYLVWRHRLPPECFGLTLNRPVRQMLWAVATLAADYTWLFLTVAVLAVFVLSSPRVEEDLMERLRHLQNLPVHDVGQTVGLLIPVALHEEVLFRGLLLPYVRRVSGRWWLAVLLVSVLFALLHFPQGWLGVAQVFGLGVLFSVFFVLSRSLLAVIVAHFVFNFLQFQLIRLLP